MLVNAKLLRVALACASAGALLLAATPTSAFATVTPITGPNPAGPWVVGTTVTPGTGQVVWTEDFSNEDTTATALPLGGPLGAYTGASGEQYTAGPNWLPPAAANAGQGGCNGWVLTSTTPNPDPGNNSVDYGCTNTGGIDTSSNSHKGWWYLQRMVEALGTAQGLDPATNAAVSSETNSGRNASDALQFQQPASTPSSAAAQAIPGHYYVASIWVAATHCPGDPHDPGGWTAPVQTVGLTVAGSAAGTPFAPPTQVCNAPVIPQAAPAGESQGTVNVHVLQIVTPPVVATSSGSLGLTLSDSNQGFVGNDMAFDTPTIIDVTPKLDKQISADGSDPGTSATDTGVSDTATLTFTITNAYSDPLDASPSVLDAKLGWSFTDTLPTNMTVDSVPAQDPTNGCTSGGGPATVDTSTAGVIELTGDLIQDQEFCTITVTVKVANPGTYVNGPDTTSAGGQGNFGPFDSATGYSGLSGLWPPSDATLIVPSQTPSVSTSSAPPTQPVTPAVQSQAGSTGASATTGGSATSPMVLWPMLALILTGAGVWLVRWRRKVAL